MLTRLMVLGLLSQQPLSGYMIQHLLQESKSDQWAGVLPGSIYHALKKLASEGLVVLQATEHAGNRTASIYAITPAGIEEFRRLLREAWRTPMLHFPLDLYAAMSFVGYLPHEEVVNALDEQIVGLERELTTWNEGEKAKSEVMTMPEYLRALFANGREHIEIDLRLLHSLREMLSTSTPLSLLPPIVEKENL